MARTARRLSGDEAENLAYRNLRRAGLDPVTRNYHCRHVEIDLIMLDGDCLVFIEVRYRGGGSLVDAVTTVDARKQRKLVQTANVYLSKHPRFQHHSCRFDVVGVDRRANGDVDIRWIRDAFRTGQS